MRKARQRAIIKEAIVKKNKKRFRKKERAATCHGFSPVDWPMQE